MSTFEIELTEKLTNIEFTKIYGEERAKVDFGITLTKARKLLDISQKDLAEQLGVTQPYISKLEKGEANPTLGTIGTLLAIIGFRLTTDVVSLKPLDTSKIITSSIPNIRKE